MSRLAARLVRGDAPTVGEPPRSSRWPRQDPSHGRVVPPPHSSRHEHPADVADCHAWRGNGDTRRVGPVQSGWAGTGYGRVDAIYPYVKRPKSTKGDTVDATRVSACNEHSATRRVAPPATRELESATWALSPPFQQLGGTRSAAPAPLAQAVVGAHLGRLGRDCRLGGNPAAKHDVMVAIEALAWDDR